MSASGRRFLELQEQAERIESMAQKLLEALIDAAEAIKDLDGGDPTTKTGWKSEEYLDHWLKAKAVIDEAQHG